MSERLTKRFIIKDIENIDVSEPIKYERYYINDNLRIQKKNDICEKEILNDKNVVISKERISIDELEKLRKYAYKEIIRDSYLYLNDKRISIKKYYGIYEGLLRVEVSFENELEMKNYEKLKWMGKEITDSSLAFDKYLSKLNRAQFLSELNKYI